VYVKQKMQVRQNYFMEKIPDRKKLREFWIFKGKKVPGYQKDAKSGRIRHLHPVTPGT
jgi:hypothetical protein